MIGWLTQIETWLQQAVEGVAALKGEVQPLDIVRQIEREIERNRKIFVNDQILVPHRLVVHLYAPTPDKVDEYEALFNTQQFREWIEAYIKDRGYQLLDRLRTSIECHEEARPEFKGRACWVEFSWPQVGVDPTDYTVLIDPKDHTRILSVEAGHSEVPVTATLEVVAGKAYEPTVRVARITTNLGRTEHVVDHRTRRLLRVNHVAFTKPATPESPNHTVSRRHAHITFTGGRFLLVDDGSQNGTKVQRGERVLPVPKGERDGTGVALESGDVIALGRARVRFTLSLNEPSAQ